MQFIKRIVIIIFTFINCLFIITPIAYGSTRYYLVSEATTLNVGSPPGANVVVFKKNIFEENNTGGRFVISSNPDGTGNIQLGDELVVTNINAFKTYSYLATTNCVNFNSVLPPTDITHITMPGTNNFTFVIRDRCARRQTIGNIYLVHLDIPGVDPFLELPWDYKTKGLTFTEAALSMSSYFDHEYPLLSSGLSEGIGDQLSTIMKYEGTRTRDPYSSHDGYDWAKFAKAEIGDPVLAAAKGEAIYVNTCVPCGNMILIDHKNGYQTRYLHLQKDGLITNVPGVVVPVEQGQIIGKIGATGNVTPAGDLGAHIHFGVVQDKNKDGNFNDNIPDGLVDPFGWQATGPDPWEKYTFEYNGQQRTGNKSYYLWQNPIQKVESSLSMSGGTYSTGKYTITFPPDIVNQPATVKIVPLPRIKDANKVSLSTAISAEVISASGSLIKSFLKPYLLEINFGDFDETKFIRETLSIYSSEDGVNWQKENTNIDWETYRASTQLNHLTQFALLAERKDTTPPETKVDLRGKKGNGDSYINLVNLELQAEDNVSGTGVDYTMYRINGGDWQVYEQALLFDKLGHYKIEFYSADNDENIENLQSQEFDLVDNPPEAEFTYNPLTEKLDLTGQDEGETQITKESLGLSYYEIIITDKHNSTLKIKIQEQIKKDFLITDILSLQYNNDPIIDLTNVQLSFNLKKRDELIKSLDQTLLLYGQEISLRYKENKDVTTAYLGNEEEKKISLEGLKLLKLFTENGSLKYQY